MIRSPFKQYLLEVDITSFIYIRMLCECLPVKFANESDLAPAAAAAATATSTTMNNHQQMTTDK